jgi:hypothetical protein
MQYCSPDIETSEDVKEDRGGGRALLWTVVQVNEAGTPKQHTIMDE